MAKTIKQEEMERFELLKLAAKEYNELRKDLIIRYEAGAKQQKGPLQVAFIPKSRVSVPWKTCFVKECGEAKANEVIAEYPESQYYEVQVVERIK